jgi:hypothetical protein
MQKLITKKIEDALRKTPYGKYDGVPVSDKKVIARFFCPWSAGTWYVLEDSDYFSDDSKTSPGEPKIVYGLADLGYGGELGDFSIQELSEITGPFGLKIERDSAVDPFEHTLGELMKLHNEEMGY